MNVWWRRNRLWLVLLLPLLLAALVASSFRLVTLYLPWEWSRPIVAGATVGTLEQTFLGFDGQRLRREVQVEVVDLTAHDSFGDARAAAGGVLWRVVLGLEAEPDQLLDGCHVELTDADGTRYDYRSGLVPAADDVYYQPPVLLACVPEEAPGPRLDPLSGEPIESPMPRPRAWQEEVLIAMPEGVAPTGVRIGWNQPDYLLLQVP